MGMTSEIESILRGWLAVGTYALGGKRPSERTLAEQLGAGRTTLGLDWF